MAGLIGNSNKGYQKLTVDATTGGVSLTVPAGSTVAVMRNETNPIRYRDDGTNPSTTDGMLMNANDIVVYTGDLLKFKAIRTGGSSGTLHISYYGPPGAARSSS